MNAHTLTAPQATRRVEARDGNALTGTGRLFRFALRRDRGRIPAWALGIGSMIGYFAAVVPLAYPDQAALQTRAQIMKDPAGALLAGPGYGLDNYTLGTMIANEILGMAAVAAALMSVFLVIRHTRAEEESGRAELISAGRVGRAAPLTAALATLVTANAAVFAVLAAAMVANGLAVADSLAVAAGVGLVGVAFGAVGAVTAQLTEHARPASGLAGAMVGLAFILRGIGDSQQLGGSTLSWLSPIGWAQQSRAFFDLRWWPLLLCVAFAAALVPVAYFLAGRRDLGAGLIPARPGRANATGFFVHPAGLRLRMERGSIISWCAGLFVFAALTGSLGEAIVASFEAQPELAAVLGMTTTGDVLRGALAAFLKYFAMAVAVYAVISVNRLGKEESEGRTGAVLATKVTRAGWIASVLLVTIPASALLLAVSGLGLGVGALAAVGGESVVGEFTAAGLAFLPLVLCFAGAAVLAYGLHSGTWWVWVLLVASMLIGLYGPALNMPEEVLDAEPFGLVPAVPSVELDPVPLLWMSAAAVVLTAAGTFAFRRRDLEA
ncbi:polyketide antibiotic transporter [Pseudarthrobacter sp. J75]|uniref:ABC transporter permease n=1 Tax=unclassified Pseudarthrobacter TaxID=2647000 RepID=UPI002E80A729|nr:MULTISPECIES: polyketide antibiotic transporter [unclassified Pseudarthrobacter]MEE2522354.1 polyketide antibiotic transporter [Pseudarthrobacter sp. J47]MEE2528000.1 polyketide antibiotic transporter [Pseudarthrobacter sp. J75]